MREAGKATSSEDLKTWANTKLVYEIKKQIRRDFGGEYVHEQHRAGETNGREPWNARTCGDAAEGGHIAILDYLRQQGCAWDADVAWRASRGGHIDLLKWCRAQQPLAVVQALGDPISTARKSAAISVGLDVPRIHVLVESYPYAYLYIPVFPTEYSIYLHEYD